MALCVLGTGYWLTLCSFLVFCLQCGGVVVVEVVRERPQETHGDAGRAEFLHLGGVGGHDWLGFGDARRRAKVHHSG